MSRRLSRFRVEGLFDLYNHDIALNKEQRVTAIIGPNGLGKTICLKLIDALLNKRFSFFYGVEFSSCSFYFDDGSTVRIARDVAPSLFEQNQGESSPSNIMFEFRHANGEVVNWSPSTQLFAQPKRLPDLERYLPFLTQMSAVSWLDERTGQRLQIVDIIERYRDSLPPSIQKLWPGDQAIAFSDLLQGTKCRLIETQRLLVVAPVDEDTIYRRRVSPEATQLAVENKARTLKKQIETILTQYAALSQSLDRSFPRRILRGVEAGVLNREEIDGRLADLEVKRQALENVGILAHETESVTQVPQEMDTAIQRVISIYIEDTLRKLSTFDKLQRKIALFEELIKKRFTDKRIKIDRETGFKVSSESGKPIPLSALSSGEQHQLVLIFELLFETDAGDLILIDEPELSLHVTWQKAFINDLLRIIDANPFDAVLATHSPVLIGHHYDLATELKGNDV